jgi:kynurenine 3-monooxygenase
LFKNEGMKKKVVIVGGGLVGCLWAVFLAKRGYVIDVYERRGDMRAAGYAGGRSINLAMSTRGWNALEKAGISEQLKSVAIPMPGRIMHSTQGELTFQPYGKDGQAIYSVSRGGLNKALLELADSFENVQFHFHEKCVALDDATCQLTFEHELTKAKTDVQSDLVFATDGAYSAIRNTLQRQPRFNYSQQYLEYGYKELTIPATATGDYAMDPNGLHIWPRGSFMMIALPNPDRSFTCTLFMPFDGEHGFELLQTEANLVAFFEKYYADTIPLMPDYKAEFFQNPTPALVTVKCHPWSFKSKVLLIGDAAHAIVPFYGQGMNCGFEDCTILDELMDEHLEDWDKIIAHFDATRHIDSDAVAELALRNFIEMRDLVGDPKFLLRQKIAAYLSQQYPTEFLPLYTQVTFSFIPYHKALAEGLAQDRLFEKILDLPNIENDWTSAEVHTCFKNWLTQK